MSQRKVFLSHSAKEPAADALLQRLYAELSAAGFAVLLDKEELRLGNNWRSVLNFWIGGCNAAVVLLSQAALESDFVNYEASVLKYRHDLDPAFLLIPVMLDPVNHQAVRNSRLEPTQIHEVQGIVSGGEPDQIVPQVLAGLAQLSDAETPLETATLYVEYLLDRVPPFLIQRAAQRFRLDPGPWVPGANLKRGLALRLLAAGLEGSSETLRDLRAYLPEPKQESLEGPINVIGSSWVDFHALKRLPELARTAHPMGVNGERPLTARLYVIRACELSPTDPWKVAEVTAVAGEDLNLALPREIRGALHRLLGTRSDSQLKEELEFLHSQNEPTVVALPAQGLQASLLAELRNSFPGATFFLLIGEGDPPDQAALEQAQVELLTPLLPAGVEAHYCGQYQDMRHYLLGERPDER